MGERYTSLDQLKEFKYEDIDNIAPSFFANICMRKDLFKLAGEPRTVTTDTGNKVQVRYTNRWYDFAKCKELICEHTPDEVINTPRMHLEYKYYSGETEERIDTAIARKQILFLFYVLNLIDDIGVLTEICNALPKTKAGLLATGRKVVIFSMNNIFTEKYKKYVPSEREPAGYVSIVAKAIDGTSAEIQIRYETYFMPDNHLVITTNLFEKARNNTGTEAKTPNNDKASKFHMSREEIEREQLEEHRKRVRKEFTAKNYEKWMREIACVPNGNGIVWWAIKQFHHDLIAEKMNRLYKKYTHETVFDYIESFYYSEEIKKPEYSDEEIDKMAEKFLHEYGVDVGRASDPLNTPDTICAGMEFTEVELRMIDYSTAADFAEVDLNTYTITYYEKINALPAKYKPGDALILVRGGEFCDTDGKRIAESLVSDNLDFLARHGYVQIGPVTLDENKAAGKYYAVIKYVITILPKKRECFLDGLNNPYYTKSIR